MMTQEELISFEKEIAETFNRGEIRAPIHLSGGNEEQLIEIFQDFREGDWTFSTWRSHYHALLTGVPPEKVRAKIMGGKSMTLCWPEHHFFSSAIVAGCCPIALGVAWQIKQRRGEERVWLFLGDMAIMTGLAVECINYARWHKLPLIVVLEDNKKSVCTDTHEPWGLHPDQKPIYADLSYEYALPWPHAGSGKRINF